MDAEQTIAEIERLERIFAAPDIRPLSPNDLAAVNRRHDEKLAHSWSAGFSVYCCYMRSWGRWLSQAVR